MVSFFIVDIALRAGHASVDSSYGFLDVRRLIAILVISGAIFCFIVWPTGILIEYAKSRTRFVRHYLRSAGIIATAALSIAWSLLLTFSITSKIYLVAILHIIEYATFPAAFGFLTLASLTFRQGQLFHK